MVERGEFIEAIEEFYAPQATMQENLNPPRRGPTSGAPLQSFAGLPRTKAVSYLPDGDPVAINWIFDCTGVKGRKRHLG